MPDRVYNVLFLCTGNSARSVIAEAVLNKIGEGRFCAFSAGSRPKGAVNPNTLKLLSELGYDISSFRSKSWNEFAADGAPQFDFIFTVCDDAAHETCPVWPGKPATAHWGIPDPAAVTGTPAQISIAFSQAYQLLSQRIASFAALPIESMSRASLKQALCEIGRMEGATHAASDAA
jgi:arsenate reductase